MATRPPELIHALDDKPPPLRCLLVALQHVAVICPTLVLVAILVNAGNESEADAQSAMGRGLLAIGIMTILQALRTRHVGSGFLLPPVMTATYLPASLAAVTMGGIPLVAGMTIIAGTFQVFFSRLIRGLRKIFPAVVSGVILMAVAMELCHIGMAVVFDAHLISKHTFRPVAFVALATLIPIIAFAVWGRGLPKMLCSLIGIISGYLAASVFGVLTMDDLDRVASLPVIAFPSFQGASFSFSPEILVPFLIASLANGIRTVGILTTCEQLNDADWKKSDVNRLERGVLADGLGCISCGLLGTAAAAASPSLVGVQKTTGVTSRVIAWYVAGFAILLACLPMVAMFIVQMPKPVMGAALFFNGSMMFVAGVQVASSRPLDLRSTLVVGFSVMLGAGVLVFPNFFEAVPPMVRQFTNSPISVAVLTAVLMNALFMIGRWQFTVLKLQDDADAKGFRPFFTQQAIAWKLPADERNHVVEVVEDLLQQLGPSNLEESSEVRAGFDGFDVKVDLFYNGVLPSLSANARPRGELVEEQNFAAGLSGYLSSVRADRIDTQSKGDRCQISLVFKI